MVPVADGRPLEVEVTLGLLEQLCQGPPRAEDGSQARRLDDVPRDVPNGLREM
jgi:hypothetical protein